MIVVAREKVPGGETVYVLIDWPKFFWEKVGVKLGYAVGFYDLNPHEAKEPIIIFSKFKK